MAPTSKNKKNASSSSKAKGSIPVKRAAATPSKSKKAEAAVGPIRVYVVMGQEGYLPDGFHSSSSMTSRVVGVYHNEKQAYAAGIRHLIQELENRSSERPELREIAKTRRMSLKTRMEKIMEEGNGPDDEQVILSVEKSELIPSQAVDEEKLLDGLKKTSGSEEYSSDGKDRSDGEFRSNGDDILF